MQTTQTGGQATFSVVLNSQPLNTVTVSVSSSDPTQGTPSVSTLTFTSANWNQAQTVTVTGQNGIILGSSQPYSINLSAASGDASYNGATASVALTNLNQLYISTSGSLGLVTTEDGGTASFTVALNQRPLFAVTLTLVSSDPVEGALSPTTLTFTPSNWNQAQTVTVTGLDDHIVHGDQTYQITGSTTSLDPTFNGLAITPILVTNKEEDVAGVNVTGSTFLVAEDNSVVRVNALTGAVIATYSTGLANDGATFGPDGSLYVADYYNNQIDHYSASGTFLSAFGAAYLSSPQGLTFGPNGNLYVTNVNSTVQEFSPGGTFLGTFITAGSGGLNNAKAIVFGADGNAYVSSYYNSEVLEYNGTTGAFLKVFATGSGGFEGLTFGPDGNLYVASYGDNAIYRYSGSNGASLRTSSVAATWSTRLASPSTPRGTWWLPHDLSVSCRPTAAPRGPSSTT